MPTAGELLFRSYANLAMAHAAVEEGAATYGRLHFMIRARLLKGLSSGTMSIGSLLDDERLKMTLPQACAYCGGAQHLSLDHLVPRIAGGGDSGDNVVWACRSCNSSKGGRDLLVWMKQKGRFPPLLLLRRYLKLALADPQIRGLMSTPMEEAPATAFALGLIPTNFPAPSELALWVEAARA